MPTPIVETIRGSLITALGNITTGNGYNFTVTVESRKQQGNTPAANKLILAQTNVTPEDGAAQFAQWVQHYVITAYVQQSNATATAIDIVVNQMRSDIEKAVMADPHRTVSGTKYAIDTILEGAEQFTQEGGAEGISVLVGVRYDVLITDPYTRS